MSRNAEITRTRIKGDRWCRLEVELRDGRLSICGSEGEIVTPKIARRLAREYWESYFAEDRSALHKMNDRLGTNYRTAKGAARFVLTSDGEYHGIDVDHETNGRVFLLESCGQIVDTLRQWFPEVAPYLKYHLNDMHAECVHQEARGETYKTHPGAECPDCGYRLGSAWQTRELPPEVVNWVEGLRAGREVTP